MLAEHDAIAVLAVEDLSRARQFYEEVLGFTPQGDVVEGVRYSAGSGTFFVYPSAYAGTNKATALSFDVATDAFDAEVAHLRRRGVRFLTFEMEGMTWDDGVATIGSGRGVWFEDPDGNILNIDTM